MARICLNVCHGISELRYCYISAECKAPIVVVAVFTCIVLATPVVFLDGTETLEDIDYEFYFL